MTRVERACAIFVTATYSLQYVTGDNAGEQFVFTVLRLGESVISGTPSLISIYGKAVISGIIVVTKTIGST